MNPESLIPFTVVVTVVFLVVDQYILTAWARFCRSRRWSKWLYYAPMIFSLLLAIASLVTNFSKISNGTTDGFGQFVQPIVAFWFLPKVVILPFIVFSDLVRLVRWIVRRRKKSEEPAEEKKVIPPMKRREFLRAASWSLVALPHYAVGKGLVSTVNDIQVVHITLPIHGLPSEFHGFTIAQISDIHSGSFTSAKVIRDTRIIVQSLKPQAIIITGDFVNFKAAEFTVTADELRKLHAELGVFASLGNHDHYNSAAEHKELVEAVRGFGYDLLINESRQIQIGGGILNIAGIDNTGFKQEFGDLPKALSKVERGAPTLLLAHDPTFWDKEVKGKVDVAAMFSGHTHGGQIAINVFGLKITPAQFVYKQWTGLYQEKDQFLYVNHGIGTVGPPVRVGVPPEITLFTLESSESLA